MSTLRERIDTFFANAEYAKSYAEAYADDAACGRTGEATERRRKAAVEYLTEARAAALLIEEELGAA